VNEKKITIKKENGKLQVDIVNENGESTKINNVRELLGADLETSVANQEEIIDALSKIA